MTLRVLAVGHSYCVALNRSILRQIAQDPEFEVTVAGPASFHGDLRPIEFEPEPEGSALRTVPLRTWCSRWIHIFGYGIGELRRLRQDSQADVVQLWEEPYVHAGYQLAQELSKLNVPLCFRTFQNLVKSYPPPFRQFERSVLGRSQAWIGGGHLVRDAMIARGLPADRGQVLTLAVDTSAFHSLSQAEKAELRDDLGLTSPVIGYVGRLTKPKGLLVLIEAMERMAEREWNLLLLGSGPLENVLRDWIARHGWEDRVKIHLARHDDVPRYLGAMDVMVAPSQTAPNWKEQFGRMLVEAFACGVPVVGSDSGEIPYVMGDAGLVVPETDAQSFADAICRMLDDSPLRQQCIAAGFERATYYGVPAVAERYKEFYRWLSRQPIESTLLR